MNLLDLVVTISAEDKASSQIEGVSTKSIAMGTAIGTTLGNLVSTGIQAAAGFIVDFGKQSIEAGMNFDSAMAQVAATMGVTTADIGDLTNCAKEMGATTAFSATEAAEALNYMALAGYDSQTSMQMLPNVLNLAAAGSMDLATASDMVTDSQTALGLSLEETNVLVDQMAQTSSKSNTSVQQLGDAILTVGGTAKNLSGGVTEMNTVLGLLADNGIKGSEAGTHLRNMILSLTAPTDTAAAALADLGVSATDAEGNMRPLEDVMKDFNVAFADMTAEEKTQALSKIFNKTDLAAVNALLDTSVDRWDELGASIDDAAGAAEKMAQTQLDNLAGDMTLLQSATEGVQLELAAGVTPALRDMVQIGSNGLSQMAEQLRGGDILGGFETLGQTVTQVATSFLNALPQFVDAGIKMLAGFIKGFGEGLPQMIPALVQAVTDIARVLIENIPLLIEAALALVVGLAEGLVKAIPVLVEAIPQIITAVFNALIASLPILIDAGVQLFTALVQNLPAIIAALVAVIPQLIEAIVNGFLGWWGALAEGGVQILTAIAEGIISAIPELGPVIEQIVTFFAELPGRIWEFLVQIVADIATWIGELAAGAAEVGTQFVEAIVTFVSELPGRIAEFLNNIITNVGQWVNEMIQNAQQAGSEFLNTVVNFITQLPGRIAEFLSNIISNVAQWVSQMISNAQQVGSQFLNTVVSFISQLPGQIAGFCANIIGSIASWVSQMISKATEMGSQFLSSVNAKFGEVVSFFAGLPGRIIGAIGNAGSMLYSVGTQIIQGLINGIKGMISSAISAVTSAVSGIVSAAKGFLGIRSPSRVFAEIGKFTMEGLDEGLEKNAAKPIATMKAMASELTDIGETIGDDWDLSATVNSMNDWASQKSQFAAAKTKTANPVAELVERTFNFEVNITNTGTAQNEGRRLGEALYTEYARLERRTA